MLTKEGVKLLDFGLAKAMAPAQPAVGTVSASPTGTGQAGPHAGRHDPRNPPLHGAGAGGGQEADSRTDIFALGRDALRDGDGEEGRFPGPRRRRSSPRSCATSRNRSREILPMSPPALDRIIGTCLAKEPDHRWQSAADVGLQLASLARGGTDQPPAPARGLSSAPRWLLGLAAAGVLAAAALTALFALRRPSSPPAAPIRFAVASAGWDPVRVAPTAQSVRRFAGWAAPRLRRAQRRWAGFSVGAVARRAVGRDAPRHGRRRGSFLVAGQPLHRLLRGREAQEDRFVGRASGDALRGSRGVSVGLLGKPALDPLRRSRATVHEPRRGGRRRSQRRSEGGCLAAGEGRPVSELPSRRPPLPLPGGQPDREAALSPSGEHPGRQDVARC